MPRISSIEFTGNKVFKTSKLRNIITSEENKFWKFLQISFPKKYNINNYNFIIFGLLFWEWIPSHDYKNESQKESSKQWMFQSFVFVAMLIFFLVIARGGLQPKPIDRIDAVDYADEDQTAVVLNTPFCIMKTLFKKEKLPYLKYFVFDYHVFYNNLFQL